MNAAWKRAAMRFLPGMAGGLSRWRRLRTYDRARLRRWERGPGGETVSRAEAAYLCALLEAQPHFRSGLCRHFWPQLDATDALIAAAESVLEGGRRLGGELSGWPTARADDTALEAAMSRFLNGTLHQTAAFCGQWAEAFAGRGYPGEPVVARMASILERLPGRALDLGAGGMPFLPVLRRREHWMETDLGCVALRAMRYALDLDPRRLACVDAQDIPFPDASFHVIVSRYVIENVLRPDDMIVSVARVLAPGGSLVLTVPVDAFGGGGTYPTNRRGLGSAEDLVERFRRRGVRLEASYPAESVFHFMKPGPLDPGAWTPGWRDPDGAAAPFPARHVEGIAVALRSRLIYQGFGRLPGEPAEPQREDS